MALLATCFLPNLPTSLSAHCFKFPVFFRLTPQFWPGPITYTRLTLCYSYAADFLNSVLILLLRWVTGILTNSHLSLARILGSACHVMNSTNVHHYYFSIDAQLLLILFPVNISIIAPNVLFYLMQERSHPWIWINTLLFYSLKLEVKITIDRWQHRSRINSWIFPKGIT